MVAKIEFIYYKSDMAGRMIEDDPLKLAYRAEKERLRQLEFGEVRKIKDIPETEVKKVEKKEAGYKSIEKTEEIFF